MVQGQQPAPEHNQDQGFTVDFRIREQTLNHFLSVGMGWRLCRTSASLLHVMEDLSWCVNDAAELSVGSAKSLFQKLLVSFYQEHPVQLPLFVVFQMQNSAEENT